MALFCQENFIISCFGWESTWPCTTHVLRNALTLLTLIIFFCSVSSAFLQGFIFLVGRVSTSYCTWKSIFSLLCIAINKWFSVTTSSSYVINQKRLDILFVLQYDIIYHVFIKAEKKKKFHFMDEKNRIDLMIT